MTQTIQWTKPVCRLDADNIYIGQTEAELDVYARDGSYIMPGGCVDAGAPEVRPGKAARWDGTQWQYLDDHRGKTAYDTANGNAVTVTAVGQLPPHLTLAAKPSAYHVWDSRQQQWQPDADKKAQADAAALAEGKTAKLSDLTAAAQACIDQVSGADKLPAAEVQSWALQAMEAKAWAADHNAATPILDTIAAARGVPADMLKQRALDKAVKYEYLCAAVIGQRQALQTRIEAAKTLDDLNMVEIIFRLPPDVEAA